MPAEKGSKDFQLSMCLTCLEKKKVDMSYKVLSKSETQTFKKKNVSASNNPQSAKTQWSKELLKSLQ